MLGSVLVMACGAPAGGPASLQELRALPEDHLFYPGSTSIGETGNDDGLDGGPPDAGFILGTSAGLPAVASFYRSQLSRRGWHPNDSVVFLGTAESAVFGWTRGPLVFRLGFDQPGDPRNPGAGRYPTVYSIDLSTRR
jgi:hypothetical protein